MIIHKIYALLFCLTLIQFAYSQSDPCAHDYVQNLLMEQNPAYQGEVEQYIRETLPAIAQQANSRTVTTTVTIPVVVHVIHTGQSIGNGPNLSVDRILSQIDILNQDYRRSNSDANQTPSEYDNIAADTEVQFCLANLDENGSVTSGITRNVYSNVPDLDYIENTIKPETGWDSNKYLNIWTIDIPNSNVIGYSYLPTPTIVGFPKDGVVIEYTNFGYVSDNNRGRTCIHEVGHYLGLQHTWGGQDSDGNPIGCTSDDGVADTPNCSGPHYGCPSFGLSSCGSTDMVMNYMEYVDDNCMNLFTNGQKDILQTTLTGIRSPLIEHALTACSQIDQGCLNLSVQSIEMGFEANQPTNGWVVENANADTRTWLTTQNSTDEWGPNEGEGLAVYLWNTNGITPADDYLFTPCFEVKNNHTYRLSFSYACAEDNSGVYNEDFEVGLSEEQTSEDFEVINSDWIFENINNPYPNYNDEILFFEADSDGFRSIGFHAYSAADRYALQIDDITVEDMGLNSQVLDSPAKNSVQASPNPTNGEILLNMNFENLQKEVEISIFDVAGRLVETVTLEEVQQFQAPFDLSKFGAGIYIINVKSADFFLTEKILLNK